MAVSQTPLSGVLRDLASLMMTVAGESVTMIKRSAPDQAMKLKKRVEWQIYLEFLKVLFNLADRMSTLYLPIQEQSHFMDSLEGAVTQQLKNVLAPALAPGTDDMEITVTIGRTVSDSRDRYERFRFLISEESPTKDEYFKAFGEQVAHIMDVKDNGQLISTATLCAATVIPVMKALFETAQKTWASPQGAGATPGSDAQPAPSLASGGNDNEIKLVSVMSTIEGEEVETRWGLHPRFRQDLKKEHMQELSGLMNRITRILGGRYAAVAFSQDWASWHESGHA